MAFNDNIKQISPSLSQIKDNTPAIMVGDKVLVNGIGGNFIPGGQTVGNQFYKCASYTPATPGGEDQNKIIVSGSTIAAADINGIYEIEDSTQTGESRVWKHQTQYYWIVWDEGQAFWVIASAKLAISPSDWFAISYGDVISDIWTDAADLSVVQGMETAYATTPSTPASWTGYKAVLSQGFYSFESTLTTDTLTCSNATFIPVVGGIYTADALGKAELWEGIPVNGLVFYAPLKEQKSAAETGQLLTTVGSAVATTYKGVPCTHLPSNVYIHSILKNAPSLPAFTMTCWHYTTTGGYLYGITNGVWNQQTIVSDGAFYYDSGSYIDGIGGGKDNWIFFTVTWDGNTLNCYRGLSLVGQKSISSGVIVGNKVIFGAQMPSVVASSCDVYIAGFRVYNRVLSASEIAALAGEFTPTDA